MMRIKYICSHSVKFMEGRYERTLQAYLQSSYLVLSKIVLTLSKAWSTLVLKVYSLKVSTDLE
jgi:hypothetical protein